MRKWCITKVENHLATKGKESMQLKTERSFADGGVRPTLVPSQSVIVRGE